MSCSKIKDICLELWADESAKGIPVQVGCRSTVFGGGVVPEDKMAVYVDGELVATHSSPTSNGFRTVNLPLQESKLLAIQCVVDDGVPQQRLAVLASSKDTFNTNTGWRCSDTAEPSWNQVNFNDSLWNLGMKVNFPSEELDNPNAVWISLPDPESSLYCRYDRSLPSQESFYVSGNGRLSVYVHGEPIDIEAQRNEFLASIVTSPKRLSLSSAVAVRVESNFRTPMFFITSEWGLNENSPWTC